MRKIIEEKTLYKYKELNDSAKNNAINNLISFWIEAIDVEKVSHNSNYYKAYRESVEMKTSWFLPEYIYKYCRKQLEKELRSMEFLADGTVYYA